MMPKSFAFGMIRTVCLATLAFCNAVAVAQLEEKPARPLLVLTGSDSHIDGPEFLRIMDGEAWVNLWLRHVSEDITGPHPGSVFDPMPEIDFEHCMVIAVFPGKTVHTSYVRVELLEETDERIMLGYGLRTYQVARNPDEPAAVETVTPYGFIVLPRSYKEVVVQRDARSTLGRLTDPPQYSWEEMARFRTRSIYPAYDLRLTERVLAIIIEAYDIQPGMTRADLMKMYMIEGGFSTRTRRTYVYRSCPYVKVDVDFSAVGDAQRPFLENPNDVITKISQPYLALMIMD